MCIKRRHILDAINRLEKSHRKVAKLMKRTFYNLIDHAERRGMNPLRLWVHGCIIGKTKRYKSLRYHARGRGYREKKDFCQVKVILYEKPEKDYFEEIGVGECAPGVAAVVRHTLR
jgi:ribosomal protein L22